MRREVKFVAIALLIVAVGIACIMAGRRTGIKQGASSSQQVSRQTTSFNKQQRSISDPTSAWVIVNKQRPLQPTNYAPNDLVIPNIALRLGKDNEEMKLRKEAATALETMTQAAQSQSLNLMVASGYRSYKLQTVVYGGYVKTQGQTVADTQSARPGYSEHQTGLAVDLEPANRTCEVEDCFADTPEGKWLAAHAYEYGFIMRYQQNTEHVVGYKYEPWHFRYVGQELSNEIHKQGYPPLETFFGLPPAPDYN